MHSVLHVESEPVNIRRYFSMGLMSLLLLSFLLYAKTATLNAAVTACSVNVSPVSLDSDSSGTLSFSVQNTDAVTYRWVRITRPHNNFTVFGGSATRWSATTTESNATFSGWTLSPGSSQNFSVGVNTGSTSSPASAWIVEVSDSADGSGAVSCPGSTEVAIVGESGGDTTAPVISSVTITNVLDSSLTIQWTTDEDATSHVDFGTTTGYGTTIEDTGYKTSHSINLVGLNANTTYQFRVRSSDSFGNEASSSNQTFTTALEGGAGETVTVTVTQTVTNTEETTTTIVVTATPTPTPLPDRTPPKVEITTEFQNPYVEPPGVTAEATDARSAIVKVEYSLDNGVTYSPLLLETVTDLSTTIAFSPELTEDGNYYLLVRAEDSEGNVGISESKLIIIDRLPPIFGGAVLSVGKHVVSPNGSGYFPVLKNLPYELVISTAGGVTEVELFSGKKRIEMNPIEQMGLWKAPIVFETEGVHLIVAKGRDGAGNITEKLLAGFQVEPGGFVQGSGSGTPVSDGEITVFRMNMTTMRWDMWDGSLFGQQNPLPIIQGNYSLIVPEGIYFIEVNTNGFKRSVSKPFVIENTRAVNASFHLEEKRKVAFGPFSFYLPVLIPDLVEPQLGVYLDSTVPDHRVGKPVPELALTDTEGRTVSTSDFTGQGGVIAFVTLWAPGTGDILSSLDGLLEEEGFEKKVITIAVQEGNSEMQIFKRRGGYEHVIVADSTGEVAEQFSINAVPTIMIIDGKGEIERIINGMLSKEELREYL